ncbi:MAG: hypothetical protein FVQ80_13800 [Planctomycetes bacterium]|nr:hypothetical protein [Planctomycetota bacterium]
MKIGAVFFWSNFHKYKSGKLKGRWFIYLGKTVYGMKPERSHIGTTTTKLRYYEKGGYRHNNIIYRFSAGEFGFEEDCILDVDNDINAEFTSKIENNPEITVKGFLDNSSLEKLYVYIRDSKRIDKMVKQDIFHSFRSAGLNVRKP